MTYRVWINGEWQSRDDAHIRLFDRGFRLGDAIFDTTRTFGGKLFRLEDHLRRLYRSLKYVRIDPGLSLEELERITLSVLESNEAARRDSGDFMVTQIVTRGETDMMARRAHTATKPTICVWVEDIDFAGYAEAWRVGAKLVIVKTAGASALTLDPKVKHYSRLPFVMADLEASDVDPTALPILRDAAGNVTESVAANLFVVVDDELITPPADSVLAGISRATTIELAAQLGVRTREESVQPYSLYTADEVFLTATQYSVLPVSHVDGRRVSQFPGPLTERLLAAWNDLVGLDIREQIMSAARRPGGFATVG